MHQNILHYLFITLLVTSILNINEPLLAKQRTTIVSISSNEGLPSDDIKKVFQDSNGFIWFASPEGLIRYDGYDFKIFSTATSLNNGLITNVFTDIAEDSEGNLWVATDHGVAKIDCRTEKCEFFNTKSQDWKSKDYDLINSLSVDKKDRIWIGTAGDGVVVLSPKEGKVLRLSTGTPGLKMSSNWITKVYCDSQNNCWICSWEGSLTLVNLDERIQASWQGLNDATSFKEFSPFSIREAGNNKYWLGLWGKGIVEFQLKQDLQIAPLVHINEEMMKGTTAIENIVYDIDMDADNNLWIGTPYGALKIKNPESPNFTIERQTNRVPDGSNTQYEAFSVLCDRAGLVWIGTMAGVSLLDPYAAVFDPYTIPETSTAITSQAVTAFTKDPWGRTLIGVRSIGFGSYNFDTQEFIPFTRLKPYSKLNPELNTINCFFWDNNGYLWLGTRYWGLIKLDPRTGNTIEINIQNKQYEFDSEQVQDIMQDHLGNIWVGTDKGVFKILPYKPAGFGNFSIVKYTHERSNPLSLSSNRISKIVEDSDHNIWIGTYDKGLNRLTSDLNTHLPVTFQRYSVEEDNGRGLTSNQIMTIYEDKQQNVWIGTAGGGLLKRMEISDEFLPIKELKDVVGDAIISINEDAESNLWLATNQGLIRVSTSGNQHRYNSFKQINGLQSNNFIKGAVFRDQQNHLYFGGNKGFNYFDPKTIKANPNIPPIAIAEIRVMNQTIPIPDDDEPLVLDHHKNSISITLSALSFSLPLNNKYATQLIGVDDEWRMSDATRRTVTYANLKPGNYTLFIKASNSNGIWNDTPQKLNITVNPAPYLTWWAFTIYILGIASILWAFIRKERINSRTKQALKIEHLENEKSEKLIAQKKQLFANVSNEFISPLNILSVLIENWQLKKIAPTSQDLTLARRNINRLIRFNKQFLYYSNAEYNPTTLTIGQTDLQAFTNEICDSFTLLMDKKEIEFIKEIDFDNRQVWFDLEKIDIILYNILSYSLKETTIRGVISFKLTSERNAGIDYALFSIASSNTQSDTIDNKNQEEDNIYSGSFGIELAITKQMIELHRSELLMQQPQPHSRMLSFRIPVSKSVYPPEWIENTNTKTTTANYLKNQVLIEEEVLTNLKNLTKNRQEKHTILIVEQDADLRKLLKSYLSPFFSIKEANNGSMALNTIANQTIDLMIAEVTIPAISGIELCKKVRANNKNNVPIVLTSRQVSEEERAACYMAGADSYISKPLNINTLLVRIQTLIQQRTLFANITSSKNRRHVPDINSLSEKDRFLIEVKETVESNLADANFNVKHLALTLNVSNSMLYRKLLKLIDLTPNAFIKKMRLIKATELLDETDLTISEVAFRCGFSDISYFGYAFRKEFGISPSAYQRNRSQS